MAEEKDFFVVHFPLPNKIFFVFVFNTLNIRIDNGGYEAVAHHNTTQLYHHHHHHHQCEII